MPRARLKVKPPRDCSVGPYKFTTEHPDAELRILSYHPIGKGLLVTLEATMVDPATLDHLLDEIPMISYQVLHADERTVLIQFVLPFVPLPVHAIFASENLPQFPYTIRNGWIVYELTTSQERLSHFKAELEATGFQCEVVSLTQSTKPTEPTELLTKRQHQVITTAIARGYYDTPRGCSLTDLAAVLGVSKSTASGLLHRAEGTIIKEFVATPRL
jgi:predicted DNA binding protein